MNHCKSSFISTTHKAGMMKWVLILGLGLGLSVGMALPVQADKGSNRWTLVEKNAQIPPLSEGHSGLVFLALPSDVSTRNPKENAALGETVSVFVDGNYQASLPRASWSYTEICPGTHFLNAVKDKALLSVQENVPAGQAYEFIAAGTSYFQLLKDEQGVAKLQAMDASAAREAVAKLPRAAHTISRVPVMNCNAKVAPPPAPAPVVEVNVPPPMPIVQKSYTLQNSFIFGLNRFELNSLHKDGRNELNRIIKDAEANYRVIQSVEINGYADPTGKAAYNVELSRKRADSIARYFVKSGFSANIIKTHGMGASNPIVTGCSARFKSMKAVSSCNEPNRRVEIVVKGQSRN